MSSQIIAAADLGSMSFHLLVARVREDGTVAKRLVNIPERLMLGNEVAFNKAISEPTEERIFAVLKDFHNCTVQQRQQTELLIVATEAIRKAKNGDEVIKRLNQQARKERLPVIRSITPRQELNLGLLGTFGPTLPAAGLFADSGGASTEVATIVNGKLAGTPRSLKVGASFLVGRYLPDDPPSAAQQAAAIEAVTKAIAKLPAFPGAAGAQGMRAVITGGTAHTLAKYRIGQGTKARLTPVTLAHAEDLLRGPSSEELRRRYGGLSEPRARVLYAGTIIIHRLLDWAGLPSWEVAAGGLRHGLLRAWTMYGEQWYDRVDGLYDVAEESDPPAAI